MQNSDRIKTESIALVSSAQTLAELEDARVKLLGKKGVITDALKTLGQASPEERKALGATLNKIKDEIAIAIEEKKSALENAAVNERLATEWMDVTLPTRSIPQGRIHPISQVTEEIIAIFSDLGFWVAEGPEIEDDYHNFDALNIPANHPARQMHDTFYLQNGQLLRTHTSPVQIRAMKSGKPPFYLIAPGATYRCDSDITHTPKFHQVEGLVIDKNIHMGHLKGCLLEFFKAFFEVKDVPMRFRASFFPFTEPSAEVDIGCSRENGELKIGAGKDWLEVAGCGMVHPNVLKNCGIDPNEWQGFAFGAGIERLAMLKYGIPDLRTFFESDIRWLKHYGFNALDIPTLAAGLSR